MRDAAIRPTSSRSRTSVPTVRSPAAIASSEEPTSRTEREIRRIVAAASAAATAVATTNVTASTTIIWRARASPASWMATTSASVWAEASASARPAQSGFAATSADTVAPKPATSPASICGTRVLARSATHASQRSRKSRHCGVSDCGNCSMTAICDVTSWSTQSAEVSSWRRVSSSTPTARRTSRWLRCWSTDSWEKARCSWVLSCDMWSRSCALFHRA